MTIQTDIEQIILDNMDTCGHIVDIEDLIEDLRDYMEGDLLDDD